VKIPQGLVEREAFYREIIDCCFASRQHRITSYETLMHYYTYGCSPEEGETAYNKIYPIIDTLTAFLYSADSTRFSAHLGPEVPEAEWDKVPAVSKAVNSEWLNTNADMIFGQSLVLAEVYNTAFVKTIVKDGHMVPHTVEPQCIGVYREDVNGLDRQEAIAHSYYITRSQLDSELENHPHRASIMEKLQARIVRDNDDEMPEGLRRIIVTNAAGTAPLSPGNTVRGNGAIFMPERISYVPQIAVDLIEMVELWVWNDEANNGAGDYQTVTMADGHVTIYDRPNIFVATEHPFTHICPNPKHGYFWGVSEVGRLLGLQAWRNLRIAEIKDLLAKQVDPPTSLEGWTGAIDEIDFALNKAGGVLTSSEPMSKINRYKPDISADIWQDVREIDEMFSEAAALPPLLMGRGETGVRSGRQTSELSRLGSSRIKKRALAVEDSLESLATKYFKAMRRYDADKYQTEPTKPGVKAMPFILAQMTDDVVIKVDAHSNSPLFVEDQKALAGELLEAHSIDRESFIEMLNPPMKDVLLRRLIKIKADEVAAAKAHAEQEQKMEAAKHQQKVPAK
jgi:hypothetical protein